MKKLRVVIGKTSQVAKKFTRIEIDVLKWLKNVPG